MAGLGMLLLFESRRLPSTHYQFNCSPPATPRKKSTVSQAFRCHFRQYFSVIY
jgi:hypothetical protein